MKRYEAILFDFDGVIADSEPVHWSCWQEIIAPYEYQVSWEDFRANCIGLHERGTVEWLCRQRTPPVPFDEIWAQYPKKKLLFRERMMRADAVGADVTELMRELKGDYLMAVVTSSGKVEVEPVLEMAGILPLIETAVYGGDVRNLKPAPDPYLLAVERLGTSNALVIEDSEAGVASARAAGLDVLQIDAQPRMSGLVRERLRLRHRAPMFIHADKNDSNGGENGH
jgi:HAD superfamily hydrolase (TIGR01509 family)